MKTCPVGGCERNVGFEYLMCRTDWWRVKPVTRQLVYDTFEAYEATSRIGLSMAAPARQAAKAAYEEARDEAIKQAEESRARSAAKKAAAGG